MEQFGRAYVQAVAASVSCHATRPEVDDDSVDLVFMRRTLVGPIRSPRFDAQLKTAARDPLSQPTFPVELTIKNYDELRAADFSVPRILIVVVVPPVLGDWLNHTEHELAMRRCGYWISLRGEPTVMNTTSRTVQLDRTQRFDTAGLDAILTRLQQGLLP